MTSQGHVGPSQLRKYLNYGKQRIDSTLTALLSSVPSQSLYLCIKKTVQDPLLWIRMSKSSITSMDMTPHPWWPCSPRLDLQPYLPVIHVGSLVRNLFPVFQPPSSPSDKRKQAQTETQEVLSEHKETTFYWESD